MLYHASFNVRDTAKVARALAEMLDATPIRSPSPPFPDGSWFVCFGDSNGSLLEILPWSVVLDPEAPFGVGRDDDMRPRAGSHVLVNTPRSIEEVRAIATREAWRSELVDARLFKVLKVWIENAILIELMTPEIASIYTRTFGVEGLASLDEKLRELESVLRARIPA